MLVKNVYFFILFYYFYFVHYISIGNRMGPSKIKD